MYQCVSRYVKRAEHLPHKTIYTTLKLKTGARHTLLPPLKKKRKNEERTQEVRENDVMTESSNASSDNNNHKRVKAAAGTFLRGYCSNLHML